MLHVEKGMYEMDEKERATNFQIIRADFRVCLCGITCRCTRRIVAAR